MNILIAIDSFKGSLSTNDLASAIEEGINEVSLTHLIKKIPIADGGEGTCETLISGLGGKKVKVVVKNPLFQLIEAEYGILENNTAIIEMAKSSGLTLIPEELQNPMNTTTFGVGEMIKDALSKGCREFIIGIGGSATNDGGIGMLNALGFDFYDKDDNLLSPIGSSLLSIARIDDSNVTEDVKTSKFLVACDVDNPIYGLTGAAHVYGKQKGASKEEIHLLDQGLRNFTKIIFETFKKDISTIKGAGAAGGLGGGFKGFLNSVLRPGIDIIFDSLHLERYIEECDIVITGEGKLDFQTVMGKAPIGIAKLASKHNKPVIAIAGSVGDDAYNAHKYGVTSMFSIMDGPMSLDQAMDHDNTYRMVKKKVNELIRLIDAFHN